MKSGISGIDEMVSVQHLMVANGDLFINSENGLIDFNNKSFMNSGISRIDENGAILLMKSGINGIDKMVIRSSTLKMDSSTSITIHSLALVLVIMVQFTPELWYLQYYW